MHSLSKNELYYKNLNDKCSPYTLIEYLIVTLILPKILTMSSIPNTTDNSRPTIITIGQLLSQMYIYIYLH